MLAFSKSSAVIVCFTLLALSVQAQVVSGRLTGEVLDPAGAPVPGAKITLTLQGSSATAVASETTGQGAFSLTGVRPDFYDLAVEKAGFRKYRNAE